MNLTHRLIIIIIIILVIVLGIFIHASGVALWMLMLNFHSVTSPTNLVQWSTVVQRLFVESNFIFDKHTWYPEEESWSWPPKSMGFATNAGGTSRSPKRCKEDWNCLLCFTSRQETTAQLQWQKSLFALWPLYFILVLFHKI